MRKNIIQQKSTGPNGRLFIEDDWYPGGLAPNIKLSSNAFIDTSYGFSLYRSRQNDGVVLDEATGCYGVVSFIVSNTGRVSVGKYSVLNGTTIICNKKISIGNHCMLAWGSVITDSWVNAHHYSVAARQEILHKCAADPLRPYPFAGGSSEVIIEDNCWVGFGAVVLPGVTLGRGCVIACKTIIDQNIPPYAVVAGSPAKIVKYLTPDDTETARINALAEYTGA